MARCVSYTWVLANNPEVHRITNLTMLIQT